MNSKIYKRIKKESNYVLKYNMTIRQIAKIVNISKSTVHKDLHERLYEVDRNLFKQIDNILKEHIKIRHINGGEATKLKYAKIRKG